MTSTPAPDPTAGIIAATQRLIDASRAIDTRKALEGIKADRSKNGMRGKRKSTRRTL